METIKKIIKEWLMTFSNKPSTLSSKRLERFAIFTVMLFLTTCYLINSMIKCSIGAIDFMIIITGWLGYAGFNTVQIKKDIKVEENGN